MRRKGVKKLSVEKRQEMYRAKRSGVSVAELAARFGVTTRQVYRIVKEEAGDGRDRRLNTEMCAFRAPKSEIDAYLELAESVGYRGKSLAFRALLRMATGLFELFPDQLVEFNRSPWAINHIGTNLNQLAKRVNKGQLRLTDEDRALMSQTLDAVLDLDRKMSSILDEAKSRRGYSLKQLSADGEGTHDAA